MHSATRPHTWPWHFWQPIPGHLNPPPASDDHRLEPALVALCMAHLQAHITPPQHNTTSSAGGGIGIGIGIGIRNSQCTPPPDNNARNQRLLSRHAGTPIGSGETIAFQPNDCRDVIVTFAIRRPSSSYPCGTHSNGSATCSASATICAAQWWTGRWQRDTYSFNSRQRA